MLSGRPLAALVRVFLKLRCVLEDASGRFSIDGEAVGDVDMRSLSGSSEALRFRPDMLGGGDKYSATILETQTERETKDNFLPVREGEGE